MDLAAYRAEAEAFSPGSADREYRRRAAWKIEQMRAGIPACDWTPVPDWFWAETERKAA